MHALEDYFDMQTDTSRISNVLFCRLAVQLVNDGSPQFDVVFIDADKKR